MPGIWGAEAIKKAFSPLARPFKDIPGVLAYDEELSCAYTKCIIDIPPITESGYALNTLADFELIEKVSVASCKSCQLVESIAYPTIAKLLANESDAIVWCKTYRFDPVLNAIMYGFEGELTDLVTKGVPRYLAFNPAATKITVAILITLELGADLHANGLILHFDTATKTFESELYEPHGTHASHYANARAFIEERLGWLKVPDYKYAGPNPRMLLVEQAGQAADMFEPLKSVVKRDKPITIKHGQYYGGDIVSRHGMCMSFVAMMMLLSCRLQKHNLSMSEIEADIFSYVIHATINKGDGEFATAQKGLNRLAEYFSLNIATHAKYKLMRDLTKDQECCSVLESVSYSMRGKKIKD